MTKKKSQGNNIDITKFRFLYDFILVKAVAAKAAAGLIRPDQYEDKPEFGEVISVGFGRLMEDGSVVPLRVKVGDMIFFGKYGTEPIRNNGEDYFIIREEDIRAMK